MSTEIDHTTPSPGGTSGQRAGAEALLGRPLLRLLARGEPVTVVQLATATGRSTDQVRRALAAAPDTEYDDAGRIVGAGITLNPTPHRFEVDGKQLSTWCALDTLVFPAILGKPATVSSPCHATGELVRVQVAPDGVTSVDPATAVVSLVTPDDCCSVRASFCNQIHFFSSREVALPWLAEHPGASVVPVAAAYQLGRPIIDTLLGTQDPADCC
jgi:alkylmercury lyase